MRNPATMLDLAIFIVAAVVIGGLSSSLRRARSRAEFASADARSSQEQAQILADVGRVLGASLEYRVVLEAVIRLVVPRLADWCAIDIRTSDGSLERAIASHTNRTLEQRSELASDPATGETAANRALRTGQAEQIDGLLCLPLTGLTAPIGVLTLLREHGTGYSAGQLAVAQDLASRAATAIDNARLYRAAEAARADAESASDALRAVQTVTDAALAHLDLDDLLHELLGRGRQVLQVDLAAVLVVSDDGSDLVECASVGSLATMIRGARVPVGRGVSGRVALNQEPLMVQNLAGDEVLSPVLREAGVQSFLGVPLMADGALAGVLHVDTIAPRQFTSNDTEVLRLVAERLALAINQVRLYQAERAARSEAERLAAEKLAVLAQIADCVIIADANGHISFVNDAAGKFFGTSRTSPTGATANSHVLPEHIAAGSLKRALQGTSAVIDLEVRGADERIALGHAVPVRAEDGTCIGAVLTLRDVTAERTLDRRKDEFFSNVSHDLRTPVATIKGAAEVVLQNEPDGLPDALHRMLQIINDEADRMCAVVNDLLELSRVRAGQVMLRRERTDLRQLVERAAGSIEPLALKRNQALVIETPSWPVQASVDRGRLERAIQNLVSNAQKYGPEGGAIAVQVGEQADALHISVHDDGPGISKYDLDHVFDRFYRSRDVDDRKIEGSGLGLAIAQAIVQLHGGRVEVDSAEGAGSTFTIVLPRNTDWEDERREDSHR